MITEQKDACPCGSGKLLNSCCGRFLSGREVARTPEQLMRSRFSAYYLGGYGEYLLQTWWPVMTRNLQAEDLSQRSCDWLRLEILEKSQAGDDGTVQFKAWYKEEAVEKCMCERSVFKRLKGRWYYVGGEVGFE